LTANVTSSPSAVTWRRVAITPALLTSTSSLSKRARASLAKPRTWARLDRSAIMTSTRAPGTREPISAAAASPRAASLPTMTTVAPSVASRSAVSLPIPLVAPVTRQVCPDIVCMRPPDLRLLGRGPAH
jgi:hypothetical protein